MSEQALAAALAVAHVSCGSFHSLCVLRSGAVCAWGAGAPQLGLGELADAPAPQRVGGGLSAVRATAAGVAHSAAVGAKGGALWTFGDNSEGQLGIGSVDGACALPQRVTALAQVRIRGVACGSFFTLALTATGDLRLGGSPPADRSGMSGEVPGGRAALFGRRTLTNGLRCAAAR